MLAFDLIQLYIFLNLVVLGDASTDVKTVRGIEGQAVTLNTGLTGLQDDVIYWTYGLAGAETTIATLNLGKNAPVYSERHHLDAQSGSLTIKSLTINDNGIFKMRIMRGKMLTQTFNLIVYAPLSAPSIRHIGQSRSGGKEESCLVVCSVKNERDLTLSWYIGEQRIKQISDPETGIILSLPLEVTNDHDQIYSCVADNPISKQINKLLIKEYCQPLTVLWVYFVQSCAFFSVAIYFLT
uniref:Ig-like domain-containing protein n=1 Tax=Esox lucius TaxID=8010 RepID=A0AAY5K4V0_ESOLU